MFASSRWKEVRDAKVYVTKPSDPARGLTLSLQRKTLSGISEIRCAAPDDRCQHGAGSRYTLVVSRPPRTRHQGEALDFDGDYEMLHPVCDSRPALHQRPHRDHVH